MVRVERRCILLLCVLENDNYNRHRGIIVRLVNPRCYVIALFRSFFFSHHYWVGPLEKRKTTRGYTLCQAAKLRTVWGQQKT